MINWIGKDSVNIQESWRLTTMNFEQLVYTEVLSQYNSMQKAADALHISKSGLSSAISQLEVELGVQLFDKSTSGTKLTPEGRQLLSSISDVLRDKNQLESIASVIASPQEHQTLSIQYMNIMLRPFMTTFIDGYSNKYHNLQLNISCHEFSSIVRRVTNQEIDAGFVAINSALDDSIADLEFTPVSTSKLVLMCSPDNKLTRLKRPITLTDLKTQKFSMFNDEFHDRLFERLQFQCGPLPLIAKIDDSWAMEQVVTKLNTVCFGRVFQGNLSSTNELSNLNWIDVSNIIDDVFVLGWLTNPNHKLSEQAHSLIVKINEQLKKNAV